MPIAQGAADVGFKRKAAEDNQIYDWQKDERAFQVIANQYEKNETIGTKLIKGAEAAGIKAKGLAEAAGIKSKGGAEVKVILAGVEIKKAEAFAIKAEANGKKNINDAEANKIDAEAHKTKAEAKLLEFELAQKQAAAGITTGAEKARTPEQEAVLQKRRDRYARNKAAGKTSGGK